ncbi:hypothetical protein GPL21_19520 [Bradyrhizobium pachyrhizi]|uniref:Uncharacterized protein n=1 Tax=Bradyrhizobium pachyrhizi TaxID=280333 RepID=A0A844STS0_9BRAD|nr:hypothetical protein [Bradyrhizobium pachyrhizi]MVT67294.1 hypothetical protein [Bradyrhizobium pachyrhizi]
MSVKNRASCTIIALLLCGAAPALAQTAPSEHVPLQKTIGHAGPEIVPSLIVMNARGASLQDGKLTLTGVAPNTIVFADRPMRSAGHTLTKHLMEEWAPDNQSEESFTKDPPNGTVSLFNTDGSKIRDAVVTLKTAKLEGDKLTFDVDVLEGDLGGGDGPAALFIDRFGFGGFHAGGFHAAGFRAGGFGGFHAGGYRVGGVDRLGYGRVGAVGYHPYVARGAWYRGAPYAAAAVGGAALGAAAVGAAAANAYPYCGYYPYPPCY